MRGWMILLVLLSACSEREEVATDVGSLRLGAVLQEMDGDQAFARAESVRAFSFPADHGAHPAYRSEWWYVTANLEDEAGARYGAQFTLFRQGLNPHVESAGNPWRTGQVYLAHFAISDIDGAEHYEAERLSRGHPRLAGATEGSRTIAVGDWRLRFTGEGMDIAARGPDIAAKLSLRPEKPVVLQGEGGLSRKSPGNASYYYSFPRLQVSGEIGVGGNLMPVTGLAWFDHEWSTSVLSDEQQGWDWFALHLDDGRDLMAFRLRRNDGARDPFDHGVLVAENGDYRHLKESEYLLTPLEHWRDPQGSEWPVRWSAEVLGERFFIEAAFADQRMQTLFTYWEGAVTVSNAAGERLGEGYMELTGYGAEAR